MINKNIYQCNNFCKSCTYVKKNPDGFDGFSECETDNCPSNHYKIGYTDSVGGKHTEEGNWNPKGEYCFKCNESDCGNCQKWIKKSQNIISPPPLRNKSNTESQLGILLDDIIEFDTCPSTKPRTSVVESENIETQPILDTPNEEIPISSISNKSNSINEPIRNSKTSFSSLFDEDFNFDFFNNKSTNNTSSIEEEIKGKDPEIQISFDPIPSSIKEDLSETLSEDIKDNESSNNPCNIDNTDNINNPDISISENSIKEVPQIEIKETASKDKVKSETKIDVKNEISSPQNIQEKISTKTKPAISFLNKLFKKNNKKNSEILDTPTPILKPDVSLQSSNNEISSPPVLEKESHLNETIPPATITIKEKIKNPYIKDNWLDKDPEPDYDTDGNLIQGIYKIDPNGNRKIVTVFDDDTNVRYIKTGKMSILTPIKEIDLSSRIADTQTDAWQHSDVQNEQIEGIVSYDNETEPHSEIIEIQKYDEPDDTTDFNEEEYEEIDFGDSFNDTDSFSDLIDEYNDVLFENDDEIPEPDEYKSEREEYENLGISIEEAEEIDEEYDDAEFEMNDSQNFKASILAPIGEEIARLQLKNDGVFLSVLGNCKITIKGRDDSEGFSYRDSKRFPKYIINRILDKSIYRDPNLEVVDNTFFNITYFTIKNGEIIPVDDIKLDISFDNPTPDIIKQILYDEYKKFIN